MVPRLHRRKRKTAFCNYFRRTCFQERERFDGNFDHLRDIHFALAARETAAIVGASGSGKSTLLSIIAGLDTPSQGTVHLAGQDLFKLSEDDRAALRAQKVGFVFQSFQLMGNLTALENVMLPLELSGARNARAQATEMLKRVGLGERLGHYPKVLSGGEQQRVALARAFVVQRLYLADEPTGPGLRPAKSHGVNVRAEQELGTPWCCDARPGMGARRAKDREAGQ